MKRLIYLLSVLTLSIQCFANGIQLLNLSVLNNGPGNIKVKFDLSWENSWRVNVGPNNYDGAWVFFKYKTATGNWTHISMNGNNNVIPAGFEIYQTSDFNKVGAMIYRDETNLGTGPVTVTGITLGIQNSLPYDIDVKGFAIEMVFVPRPLSRPFFGDGNGTAESANAFHYTDNTATTNSVVPMKVDVNTFDDNVIEGGGLYVYSNDTIQTASPLGDLIAFPTMKALWCMKYEINQATYRDFLNTLTYIQQAVRTANAPSSSVGVGALAASGLLRNYIEIKTPGVASTAPAVYGCDADGDNIYDEPNDGEWVACGYLTWPDVAAFLDWSGLAPMSEIQFERICRGHTSAGGQPAIFGEYAWGANTVFASSYSLTGGSTAAELASNAAVSTGNAAYNTTSTGGPLRSGIFATPTSNRITSGSAFFGVMEMSGNIDEYVITIGTLAGRSVGLIPNGNGTIAANGNAVLSFGGGFWPGMEGSTNNAASLSCTVNCEVSGNAGIVLKGGGFGLNNTNMRIADRSYFAPAVSGRIGYRGGRGVLYIR